MSASDDMDLASGLAMGTLDADDMARARIRLVADKAFAAEVQAWETRLAPLAFCGEAALPAGLFEGIEKRIAETRAEVPGTYTKRAGDGRWHEVSPGFHVRILGRNHELRRETIMLRLDPGTTYQGHDHGQDEEIYMIEGDLEIGPLTLRAGDYHIARAGRPHPHAISRNGCVCIVIQAMDH